ncbi:hypothetical protein OHS70_05815 [Streptomyces sp. NBC_00390]|uniref:hypothetical protein n=1 Tax=Streptomyces sp. NBC_00390 TaxID=2975736 RepID=UPI002E1AF196
MRTRTAHVLAGGALAMMAFCTSAATAAAEESEVSVSPEVAYPGSTVRVSTEVCGPDVGYAKGQAEVGGQINLLDGAREGELAGEFTVPDDTADGVYNITVKCPPRTRVETTIEVARRPSGPVRGGFGGAGGTDPAEIAVGSALIAGAVAGGVVLMRRRLGGRPA